MKHKKADNFRGLIEMAIIINNHQYEKCMKKKSFQFYSQKKTNYVIKMKQPDYRDFMNLNMMKR